jgi:hypothetical protein
MLKKITDLLDSRGFQIFFAIWTGVYLVQIIKRESSAPGLSEVWWVVAAFAVAVFLV